MKVEITERIRIKAVRGTMILLVLGLLAISGISVSAQTADRPLDAGSMAALVKELKEVVSNSAPVPSEAAAVAEKFDKHTDLVGKTKRQAIDMLWADVKSVITDSGTRYQIYSIFAFSKTIPDAMFSPKAPKPDPPMAKPASVIKLVEMTYRMHPYVNIDEQLASLPGSKSVKADADEQQRNRIAGFEDALKMNKRLSADQKAFVRNNFGTLSAAADKITENAIKTNFPTERWIREGLQKNYTSKFTGKELTDLIAYFKAAEGQQYLKYVRLTNMAQMITGNGGTVDLTDADKAEYDKFVATPLGTKFNAAFMKDAIAYEQSRENAVRAANPNADGFAIYQPANLNKLFNKFVAENYNKKAGY
jgi:hypothetical protein